MIPRERWTRLKPILEPAVELTPGEVPAYLERVCGNDQSLREEADALLRACEGARRSLHFLDSPAAELAAPLLELESLAHESPEELEPGTAVGPYRIERRLGRGGMGVVYLAQDHRLDRRVALKLLPPGLAADDAAKRRFVQEAKAASRLDHPNIETVYEIEETTDGRLHIAMAYYNGETLRDRMARGPMDVGSALDLGCQIAEGLAAAHAGGIVHRDIKPSNVIVTPEGVAKIVDFGAAKIAGHRLTGGGTALGTVAYMSPEQTRREDVDGRTDLWALGVLLYEMLAGRHPFPAQGPDAAIYAIRNDEPEPLLRHRPDLPEPLARLVHRCLRKDAGARHQEASSLAAELRKIQELTAGTAPAIRRPPAVGGRGRLTRRRAAAGAAVGVAVLGAALAPLLSRSLADKGEVVSSASTILVLPVTPVVDDTALRRLGRELVVTLSANFDGVGGIRAVEARTVLARVAEDEFYPLERGAELAQRLGARSFLHGSLLRANDDVRLELGLYDVKDRQLLARATATARPDDIGVLTDSVTLAILRGIWTDGESPAPSLAAITTRSLPALRAYLEGELAFARAEYDDAVRSFDRAFAADSTFWLAYWRSLYPRIYEGGRPDSAVLAGIIAHRDRMPEADRLLLEAYVAETLSDRLAALRAVTARFSTYWPGWYDYANVLVHFGPYLGTTYADARSALERVVALNPDFASGWWHLLWITIHQRDTAAADRALAGLERFESPKAFLFTPDNMDYFRALHGLLRSRGELGSDIATRLAQVALRVSPRVPPEVIATGTLAFGFPSAQLQQSDAILRERPLPEMAASQWMGKTFAWASRGAWDSALVAADHWVRRSDDPQTPLRAYGLAVVGAWVGALPAETTTRRRPDPARSSALQTADGRAELAWLDGIVSYLQGDATAIARSHRELSGSGSQHTDLLKASLGAFHRHASGDQREAARALATLEWDVAEHERHAAFGPSHPYLSTIHRLAAARWLVEAGDTLQANRLLTWHEAILPGSAFRVEVSNRTVEALALYERARLEEAMGRVHEAQEHYRGFLERYDRPPPPHQTRVEQARLALARLSAGSSGAASPRAER